MPTTTLPRDTAMREAVHEPAPIERWLAAHPATEPAAPKPYEGRHRGRPATETVPQPDHTASRTA